MENKITTPEEYEQCLEEKKKLRDEQYNIKMQIILSKNDLEMVKSLENKEKILKFEYAKLLLKIKEYEQENNIEEKKEGKKK